MSDPVVLLSTGDVVGPAGGVTDNSMVLFSGTSGKLIKGNNAVVTAAGLALLDDVNADAQRVTLGLGTAATANVTTSATNTTAGRLMKVGDFGLGAAAAPAITDANLPAGTGSGIYALYTPFTNGPAAIPAIIIHQSYSGAAAQTAIEQGTTNNRMWIRQYNGNAWLPWGEIALTNSPAFTGIPTAPTASPGTNTTQLANTAFVKATVDNSVIGVGQTWQDVTSSRTPGVTYTNTSGRPIYVKVTHGELSSYNKLYVDGLVVDESYLSNDLAKLYTTLSAIVPSGSNYKLLASGEPGAYVRWGELR